MDNTKDKTPPTPNADDELTAIAEALASLVAQADAALKATDDSLEDHVVPEEPPSLEPEAPTAPAPAVAQSGAGQNGKPGTWHYAELNAKERTVVAFLDDDVDKPRKVFDLRSIAEGCFLEEAGDPKRANSWTRNSLRRLVRGQWAERVGKGEYTITPKGRKWRKDS